MAEVDENVERCKGGREAEASMAAGWGGSDTM
jgi:hypothetical protein